MTSSTPNTRLLAALMVLQGIMCYTNNLFKGQGQGAHSYPKNVLFLMVDDMRPEISAYLYSTNTPPLNRYIHTPNMDKLAKKSILFKRAYVQEAICAPSRASILTGRRPDTTDVHTFVHFRDKWAKNFTTIPQYFKNKGYHSIGLGKIFHDGAVRYDDSISWTEPFWRGIDSFASTRHLIEPINDDDVKNSPLKDEQVADRAISYLKRFSNNRDKPFFLAVGFKRPHFPLVFPNSYLNYYPENRIKMPENNYIPKNLPKVAWSNIAFLKEYDDAKALNISMYFNASIPRDLTLSIRRAYYAAITFVDFQLGRVLDVLQQSGLENDTIIFFMSDHGFHLGENGEWSKNSVFELATWTPLMISIPRMTDKGIKTNELVEFVDIFPTLVESLGHTPLKRCPEVSINITLCSEGLNLLPLISNPSKPIKTAAFSQTMRAPILFGYSIRTNDYRYNEWVIVDTSKPGVVKQHWDSPRAVELYDHIKDPHENVNCAEEPEYTAVRESLREQLHAGWRKAVFSELPMNNNKHDASDKISADKSTVNSNVRNLTEIVLKSKSTNNDNVLSSDACVNISNLIPVLNLDDSKTLRVCLPVVSIGYLSKVIYILLCAVLIIFIIMFRKSRRNYRS